MGLKISDGPLSKNKNDTNEKDSLKQKIILNNKNRESQIYIFLIKT